MGQDNSAPPTDAEIAAWAEADAASAAAAAKAEAEALAAEEKAKADAQAHADAVAAGAAAKLEAEAEAEARAEAEALAAARERALADAGRAELTPDEPDFSAPRDVLPSESFSIIFSGHVVSFSKGVKFQMAEPAMLRALHEAKAPVGFL